MDFDDLITEVLLALRSDKLLLQILQEKFLYLLIDEHQDTNDAQNAMVKLLADFFDMPNVFIVGDEKQAIYRFQGASVENFLTFGKAWSGMKVIGLEDNYRSHASILDAAFSMVENNYAEGEHEHLRIRLRSGAKHAARPVEVVQGADTASAEEYLAKELSRISKDEPQATVAVITKTNRDLSRVLVLCAARGIPTSSERSIDIFKHPLGSLFFDLVGFFNDPTRYDLLARTLVAGLWGLPFEDAVDIAKRLRSGERVGLEAKIPPLAVLNALKVSEGAVGFLSALAERSGYLKAVSRDPDAVEVWRGILGLGESLAREGGITAPGALLEALAAYAASSESRSVKVSVGAPELPIRAMTAHGSKGLEFDYVFVPYATEESWVGRARGTYFVLPQTRAEGDIADIRRLFYVALTRARKHATVLYGLEEDGREVLTPLRFIDELDPAHVARIESPKVARASALSVPGAADSMFATKVQDYAKRMLTGSGLSVTALNHFMSCPSAFLYQSVLKLPQAPAPGAEKGNAMHQAFAEIWTSKTKGKVAIGKVIAKEVGRYFETSLLPEFEKEAVKKDLLANAPTVAKSLESHFNTEGTVFPETWSETSLAFDVEDKSMEVPVHGKLDAVIDSGDSVYVYDYKTREAMSENAIRGLTKDSSGDYFRQLVFYKILLDADSRFKGKRVLPALIFLKPDKKGECAIIALPIAPEDMERVKGEIRTLAASVWSGEFVGRFCDDPQCEWCRLKKASGVVG
jgi:DNA helicase-2/ATP-dependent DNA helicase PcrA